jgi:hypothetical protein
MLLCASPQIAKMANLQIKRLCSDLGPHWLDSNTFYLRKFILDYEMPCELSQKPKVVLKFE